MKRSGLFLFINSLALAVSSVYAMTLDDAIQAAINNENQLKISGLTVDQAQAVVQQAKKRNGLNVNLAGQIGVERIDSTEPGNAFFQTDGVRQPRALELQIDYPIYTSGRKQLGVDVASMQLQARNQARTGQQSSTVLLAVQVYTDVLKQKALLALKQQVLRNVEKSLSDGQKRFNAGIITRADVAQVQSQYAQAQADVVLAQSNLNIAEGQFVQVTGQSPEQLQLVRQLPSVPTQLEQVLLEVSRHPSIQQAKFEQQAAEKQYSLTKRELTPTLNVTSRISKQHEIANFESNSDNYMVGLQLNVPLFDQGLNRANRQKAQVDIRLAAEKVQAIAQNLTQQSQTTFAQLQAVQQNKQALNDAVRAAALALNFIQKELEFGSKTTFDALTAEQTLQDLQTKQLLNEQDEIVLVYQLLDQMGQLNANSQNTTAVRTMQYQLQSSDAVLLPPKKPVSKNAALKSVSTLLNPLLAQTNQNVAMPTRKLTNTVVPPHSSPTLGTNADVTVASTPVQINTVQAAAKATPQPWYKPSRWFAPQQATVVVASRQVSGSSVSALQSAKPQVVATGTTAQVIKIASKKPDTVSPQTMSQDAVSQQTALQQAATQQTLVAVAPSASAVDVGQELALLKNTPILSASSKASSTPVKLVQTQKSLWQKLKGEFVKPKVKLIPLKVKTAPSLQSQTVYRPVIREVK